MIKDKGILHIPISQFAYPEVGNKFTIRLRTSKDAYESVILCYGDRAGIETPLLTTEIKMDKVAISADYDWYEIIFQNPYERLCYFFKLENKKEIVYYYADRFSENKADYYIGPRLIDARSEYYQYPYIMRDEITFIPQWFRKASVYNIFPDSFASGKRELIRKDPDCKDGRRCYNKLGGTLKGIEKNLEYIKCLGCDTIYLNPIFRAVSYHKYDIIDYYHVDPAMGTDQDLKDLVEKVHSMDMHIILDGVFNHSGIDFFAFQDIRDKGKDSKYFDWYYNINLPLRIQDGDPSYSCFAYVAEMPKLNTSNKEVQRYFSELGSYYISEIGIDGWRLDVANEISKDFLRSFSKSVKDANKDAVLIGEVWENASQYLSPGLLDSIMDYDFRRVMRDYFAFGNISAEEFVDQLIELRMRYPEPYFKTQLNFLDSHDVARFLSLAQGNVNKLKQAVAFQMLFPGVPSVFYGDEKLITGVEEHEYRKMMSWNDEGITEFYKQALALHKREDVLDGKWEMLHASKDVIAIKIGMDTVAVFNNSCNALEISQKGRRSILSSLYDEPLLKPEGFVVFNKLQ